MRACPKAACPKAAAQANSGASDFERVANLLKDWETALESNDLDAALALYAKSFNSREFGGDINALTQWAQEQHAAGLFNDVSVDLASVNPEMLPGRAAAYSIKVSGPALGDFSVCLGMGKFDGVWKIDGMDTE